MRNYRCFFSLLALMALPGCAESSEPPLPQDEEASEKQGGASSVESIPLPDEWQVIGHDQWLTILKIDECEARGSANEQRLKSTLDVGQGVHLLTLTCKFGAYQDAFHIYAIDSDQATVRQVILKEPDSSDGSKGIEIAWGTLYVSEGGHSLVLVDLSSATGACGWKALYPLKAIRNGGAVSANSIYADDDCYNGVTVDQWPAVEAQTW